MRHVFVETHWLVGCWAPTHRRLPAARRLWERALKGEVILHLPAHCISEARGTILGKFQPRIETEGTRSFLESAVAAQDLTETERQKILAALDRFKIAVDQELERERLDAGFEGCRRRIDVCPLSNAQLDLSIDLGFRFDLARFARKQFDLMVLAAVLGRARELRGEDTQVELTFCTGDAHDLWPWDADDLPRKELRDLYDPLEIWVYGDYEMKWPQRPSNWPASLRETP